MSTPRQSIAAQLRKDHEDWDVVDWPATPPGELRKPRAVVWRTDLEPGDKTQQLKHGVTVQVYARASVDARAEDELDNLLDGLMLSIQRLDGVNFIKAERVILADSYAGWEVTLSGISTNVYLTHVLNERG